MNKKETTPNAWREYVCAKLRKAFIAASKLTCAGLDLCLRPSERYPDELVGSLTEHFDDYSVVYHLRAATNKFIDEAEDWEPDFLRVSLRFEGIEFPTDSHKVHDILCFFGHCMHLEVSLKPGKKLLVTGIAANLPIKSLNGGLLMNTLSELTVEKQMIIDRLLDSTAHE